MANLVSKRDRERRLEAYYGVGFPDPDMEDKKKLAEGFKAWVNREVDRQSSVMNDKRLHYARHRLFRQGRQWISTRDGRQWRELNADENRIRAVFNMIGPALDFRVTLLQEQRPGFKYLPIAGQGINGREIAIAQQSFAEYYFQMQKIWDLSTLAMSEALTDGVCFLNVYLDKEMGPSLENVELISEDDDRYESFSAQGYKKRKSGLIELPLGPGAAVSGATSSSTVKGGDLKTTLILAHETYADSEARCINGADKQAKWFMVRRMRDIHSVRLQLDDPKLEPDVGNPSSEVTDLSFAFDAQKWHKGMPPFPSTRMRMPDGGVFENKIYLAPSKEIPEGMWIELLTERHLKTGNLPAKVIPIVRFTDGSTDGELYPRPEMSDWIGDQTAINGLGSKILEFARLHAGSRVMALEGTIVKETFTDIVGSIVNYQGPKPDVLQPPRVSPDLWQMWKTMVQQLEAKTGWDDMARGQLTGEGGFQDVAGRAVLAARELFERQFGRMIRAAARGVSDWSTLYVQYGQEFFDTPRMIPMLGRPDLAKKISKTELQGPPSTYVDPETLQPLPRALRNQMLTDYLKQGLITVETFKKRAPFAEVRDLSMGDSDHWDRAQVINTVLEENWKKFSKMEALELFDVASGLPIFWQDITDVHMKALEEIILDDKHPFELRKLAADRWGIYSELAKSKDFPQELEMQGMPRPPAPAEVLGVPNSIAQRQEPLPQQMAAGPMGGGPGASPAPELSPTTFPGAATDMANPLGAADMRA